MVPRVLFQRCLVRVAEPRERRVAANKLETKAYVGQACSVRMPAVLHVVPAQGRMDAAVLRALPDEFVIKAAVSSQGRDVRVVRRVVASYVEPDGRTHSEGQLLKAIESMPRPLFAEECVKGHPALRAISPFGTMCDLRLHFIGAELFWARLRVPTVRSCGYGNVARGALGLCVNVEGQVVLQHPYARCDYVDGEAARRLDGFAVPFWPQAVSDAREVARLFASPHVGVDGTIDEDGRFVLVEVTLIPATGSWIGPAGRRAFREAMMRAPRRASPMEAWLRGRSRAAPGGAAPARGSRGVNP